MATRDQEMLWAALTSLGPAIPADLAQVPLPQSDPFLDANDIGDLKKEKFGDIFFVGNLDGDDPDNPSSKVCTAEETGSSQSGLMFETSISVSKDDPNAKEEKTIVRVALARNIDPSGLTLTLRVPETPHHIFIADSIEVNGNVLEAQFPSLREFRVDHGKKDKKAILRIDRRSSMVDAKEDNEKSRFYKEICVFHIDKTKTPEDQKPEKKKEVKSAACPVLKSDERKKLVAAVKESLGKDHFILLRHADKAKAQNEKEKNSVPLTDRGNKHAEEIGENLKTFGIALTKENVSVDETVTRTCLTAEKILSKHGVTSPSGTEFTCKEHGESLKGDLLDVTKRNGVSAFVSRSDQIKEAVDEKPELACGEAALVKVEGENVKCLARILPHEWRGDGVPRDWSKDNDGQLSESYWENPGECKGGALPTRKSD